MTLTAPSHAPTTLQRPDPRLRALLRRVIATPELWLPLIRFGAAERYWARIDVPYPVDVWLLTWTLSQGTELHDHGDAEAAFSVIGGLLHETRLVDGRLVTHERRPGSIVPVLPGELHDVRNDLAEPAISIHAYAPRLSQMTFYRYADGVAEPVRTVLSDEPEVD